MGLYTYIYVYEGTKEKEREKEKRLGRCDRLRGESRTEGLGRLTAPLCETRAVARPATPPLVELTDYIGV